MTMDKRERVARAIAESQEHDWGKLYPNEKEDFKCDADAALAALEPMDKPRVKPLVWRAALPSANPSYSPDIAQTPFGMYYANEHYFWLEGLDATKCLSREAAKAAAQADYEARILAAIDPAPVSVREAARALLGHTPKITAKPLAEMSEAMKIDAHPAILLRGFCAALRAIEDGKDE